MELNNTLSIRVFHKLETNDRRNHYIAKPHPTPKYLLLLHSPPSPHLYTILPPPPPTLNTIFSPLLRTPLLPPLPSTPPTSPLPSMPPPPPSLHKHKSHPSWNSTSLFHPGSAHPQRH